MKKVKRTFVLKETGIGEKTLDWFCKNVFPPRAKTKGGRMIFYDTDIEIIKDLQLGRFDVKNKLIKMPEYDYWISGHGKIYTYQRKFFEEFRTYVNKLNGYKYVTLYDKELKKHKTYRFHRIVALLFVDNPNGYDVVNHIDGNKLNNDASNLEWTTISYNTKHAFKIGLAHNDKGEEDSQSYPIDGILKNGEIIHYVS